MHILELDSYNLSDTVKFHDRLNPRLWDSAEHLQPKVASKLMEIARDFQEFMGVPDLDIVDITISGSNAAYNYTGTSDIDLHLVINIPKVTHDEVYRELFNAKKYEYNDIHNIRIGGADVELYAQDSEQPHHSQGIYSLLNRDWISVPRRRRSTVDDVSTRSKYEDLAARVDSTIKTQDRDRMISLMAKIKTMRQTGLEQEGEFGSDNLAFKLLRNNGYIKRLIDARNAARDAELSLAELARPRQAVTYGFTTESPDGVNPSTKMFLENEPVNHETTVQEFISHVIDSLGIDPAPEIILHSDPDWSKQNHSFGRYDADAHALEVNLADRHVMDILRTVAHELVHCRQNQQQPLPDHAGETGSAWENDANARAGVIMRDYAESNPEKFTESASGYIPKNKKEARDPRFSMALTQDIGPGQVGREANKLGLKTDANGKPALLIKSANTLAESLAQELAVFEEQDLFEINMGSKNLRREAAKTGALAGMEFEMIVPGEGGFDAEEDMDRDESTRDIDTIVNFFDDGDFNNRGDIRRLRDKLYEDFRDWQFEKLGEGWYEEGRDYLRDYVVNNNEFDGGEAEATAREELEQDLFYRDLPEAERDQMIEKRTGEMLEEFVEQEWTGQDGSIYEAAREEYESEMQDDWTESTWLNDSGLDQMSDVLREYTISWPYYTDPESNVNINQVGDDFSDAIGRPVNASDRYHGGRREAGRYVVEPDGSLDPDSDDDQGLEFVSPPLPIDEMLSDLNKVRAWAKQKGCYTNDSTGLHINISVPGFSQEKLDFVKLAVLLGDERVLENFGRAGNTYAKSAMKIVKDNIRSNPGPAAALLTKMKANMDSLATKAIHSGTTAKYTSINTKDGYVEFRSPGGDWLGDNFDLIEPTLLRFVVALDAAIDPEKYRQEYQKKLYKLLTADNKDDSTIRYFVDYVAGKIPKAALRSFVKQAQLERGLKKNPVPEPAATKEPAAATGPRQRYVVKNAAGTPVTRVVASDAATARILANRWLQQNNPGINTNEFSVEPETAENQIQNYYISDAQSSVARMAFQAGTDQEALDRLEIYNYSHPSEGGYQLSREDGTVITEPGAPIPGSTLDLQRQRQAAAAPSPIPGVQDIDIDIPIAPPRGNWNGQWRVVDSDTGQELYRFGGIGNSQADANRVAADWLRQNAPKDADMTQIEVYPVLSEGRTQEDYDPSNPPGPESPPQMPAGTIKVDVSDMYDWYKLGQNISDLKSIDKSTLGKGPPSTVFAFGSEDLENMYSHELTKLGLKTHDLDEPGEEDLDEQIVNELKINNATGVGAVPYNREIDYHGLRVTMRPSMFLRLALPLDQNDPEERKAIEYCKSQLDDQGIGAPFLTITMPEAWESDDFSLEAKVRDHDGRHRCYAILDKEGDEPIEVHLLMSGGMRRRHISDSMIKNLRNGILNQQGQYVSGPIFDTAQ
jgi:hypothetical protein